LVVFAHIRLQKMADALPVGEKLGDP
jgi:hypothetical protein